MKALTPTTRVFHALAALSALAALATPEARAASACGLSLSVSNVNLVWSLTLPTQQLAFTVTRKTGPACNFVVTFSKGQATSYSRFMASGGNHLSYQLYKESSLTNILKEVPDVTTTNDAITGTIPTGTNLTVNETYFLQIPFNSATQPTLKPPATYTDTVVMKVYPGNVGSLPASPDDTKNVNISTQLNRLIQLSLVASGASFDSGSVSQNLNFGTLTQGQSQGFDMRVLSNAGYSVTFSSANNGRLKLSTAPGTTFVPYTVTVNGATVNLASSATAPVTVATASGQTGLQGGLSPVNVTIGSTATALAGSYSDLITVTTATTE